MHRMEAPCRARSHCTHVPGVLLLGAAVHPRAWAERAIRRAAALGRRCPCVSKRQHAPGLRQFLFVWKGLPLAAKQRLRPPKNTGCAPTHRGRENGHGHARSSCLASCCRGRSGPSRRHRSRTSLAQQSQSTGRRRRRGAAECSQKTPPCAPCARTRGRSRRERESGTAKAQGNCFLLALSR
jgi:hypothetical protein